MSPFSRVTSPTHVSKNLPSRQANSLALKSGKQLREAMFVPYQEKVPSVLELNKNMKSSTKGRFSENVPKAAQAVQMIDRQRMGEFNPEYAEH